MTLLLQLVKNLSWSLKAITTKICSLVLCVMGIPYFLKQYVSGETNFFDIFRQKNYLRVSKFSVVILTIKKRGNYSRRDILQGRILVTEGNMVCHEGQSMSWYFYLLSPSWVKRSFINQKLQLNSEATDRELLNLIDLAGLLDLMDVLKLPRLVDLI